MNSICYWRPVRITEAVHSIPALQTLKAHFPSSKLWFHGSEAIGPVLKDLGLVDGFRAQGKFGTYNETLEISGRLGFHYDEDTKSQMKLMLGKPDMLIAYSPDPVNFRKTINDLEIETTSINHINPPQNVHQSNYQLMVLENLGFDTEININLNKLDYEPPNIPYLNPERTVILIPGSLTGPEKWPLDNWIELNKKLQRMGYTVIVLQGPGQDYKTSFFGAFIVDKPLKNVVSLFQQPGMSSIGVDTGMTHLAAFLGVETYCMMGPTHPINYAPIGPKVTVLRLCDIESTGAKYVCQNHECMKEISVNDILSTFIEKGGTQTYDPFKL